MKTGTKTIKKIVAGALAFVCACTAGIVGLFHVAPETDGVDHNNQLSFGSFFGSGLSIVAASAETVDATSEGKTTLTATVTPAELAPYIKVDWAIAWQNAESEWATGKTVTDYVTITPTTDGALTAEVACKAAFGEKVVVNVSARDDAMLTATCVCDYEIRPTGVKAMCNGNEFVFVEELSNLDPITFECFDDLSCEINLVTFEGVGTVASKLAGTSSLNFKITDRFYLALEEQGFDLRYNGGLIEDKEVIYINDLAYSTKIYLPGIELFTDQEQEYIEQGFKFANDKQEAGETLSTEAYACYVKYRNAVLSALNTDPYLFTLFFDFYLSPQNHKTFSVLGTVDQDAFPIDIEGVSIEQTSVLF